ncbi:MAG: co-chaperone GroES [Gemmatimonadaceae bacterium]
MAKAATASRPAAKNNVAAKNSAPKKKSPASTKLVPLFDGIVIRPTVQEEVLASGIVIPDTAKEKPQQGDVLAVGPGRLDDNGKRIAMDIQVGDRVLFAKYTGQEVKIDQEEVIVLHEKDILAKVV